MGSTQHGEISNVEPPLIATSDLEQGASGSRKGIKTRVKIYVRSKYEKMLLREVHPGYNFFAALFAWILLAGFLVLPGSFPTLEAIETKSGDLRKVLHALRNLPLLVVAYCCCAIGAAVLCYLWWIHRDHYIWLYKNIFMPGVFNGLSGLISTLVHVYATQNGVLRGPSIAALVVTSTLTVICGVLALVYRVWKLDPMKRDHRSQKKREVRIEGNPTLCPTCGTQTLHLNEAEKMGTDQETFVIDAGR